MNSMNDAAIQVDLAGQFESLTQVNLRPRICLIWAQAPNGLVGIELNETKKFMMPWNFVPNHDLIRFRKLTENHIVVMGHNTWLSLDSIPLKNRVNIVMTRRHYDTLSKRNDIIVCKSKEEVLNKFRQLFIEQPRDLFIIGGASIYNQFLPESTVIYQTIIKDYNPYYTDESTFRNIFIPDLIDENRFVLQAEQTLYPFIWKEYKLNI